MKTNMIFIILVGLLFANSANLRSQDIEPAQKPVVYCGDSTFIIDSETPQFTQNQMVKGWMWGSLPLINKALYCNQQDVWGRDTYNDNAYDCNLFVRSDHDLTVQYTNFYLYCDHGGGENRLMARAMVFNPALEIPDPITDYYAIANQCTQNNHSSVFGFKYIHPQAFKTDSGLVLLKSRFSGFSQVLNEPWDINKLNFGNGKYDPEIDGQDIDDLIQLFNGNKYYLTVNLQRLNDTDTTSGTIPVLMFKISYYDQVYQGYKTIKFATSPNSDTTSITSVMDEYRGAQAGQTNCTSQKDYMQIIKNTIPTDGTSVTYSAYFTFFGIDTLPGKYFDNPLYPNDFNIYVTYYDNCDLKINEIKIESVHAKELFAGVYDSDILFQVGKSINKYNCTNSQHNTENNFPLTKHTNYFREITSVETGIKCWAAERYFNKLVGNIGTGATGPEMPVLYDAYVNPSDKWLELPIARIWAMVAAPYMKGYVDELDKDKTMGVIGGFDLTRINVGDGHALDTLDTLNSGYETFFRYNLNRADFDTITNEENKLDYINFSDASSRNYSLQYYWEDKLKEAFYRKDTTGFQYSDKPWWSTNFPLNEFKNYDNDGQYQYVLGYRLAELDTLIKNSDNWQDSNKYIVRKDSLLDKAEVSKQYYWARFYRPLTAEELRLIDYTQILMGSRGLTYDGAICSPNIDKTQLCFDNNAYKDFESAYLASPISFDYESFLLSDDIGSDFVDDSCRLNTMMSKTYYLNNTDGISNKDVICRQYMGCDINRIYTGLKSNRWELYKIHKWLSENDNTLMGLKLISWYGKGFLKMYNQHPSITTDTILDTYVYLDSVKTRKKWQADSLFGYTAVASSHKEVLTEQFYDITLLKEEGMDLSDLFYVGYQNRRTDPLVFQPIFWIMPGLPGSSNTTYKLCYYTGAELDLLADSGGDDPYSQIANPPNYPKNYWQERYEKRLGFRILELPIRRLHKITNERLCGLFVSELTYKFPAFGTAEFDTMSYWLKYEYDNQIYDFYPVNQFTFGGYEKLDVPLQPGRGKILRIDPIYQKYNFDVLTPKPQIIPTAVDTCEYLRNNVELFMKKADSTDANNCVYEIYCINKSDTFNINVPIIAEFITDNPLDTTKNIPSGFQYLNYKKHRKFVSVWIPDSAMSDTSFVGTFIANCDSSRVIYKIGLSTCYKQDTLELRCGICSCCDSVTVSLEPITTQIQCRLFPHPSQRITLNTGENCDYYGMRVTGGFVPEDTQTITDLGIPFDTLAPIDLSTYNEWIADPFMFLPFGGEVTYCLHFSMLGKNGLELCQKDYCLSIDTEPIPNLIAPVGIISSDCYATVPAKRSIPLEDIHSGQMIIVDPNPTSGKTNVKLNLENDLVGRLVLYTSTGELIQEIHNGKLTKGTSNYEINLSDYPSGMYIITIESDGMSYIKKFVKE